MWKNLEGAIGILLVVSFLITLPAAYQNNKRVDEVKPEIKKTLDLAKEICSSDCENISTDWEKSGYELQAKEYCRNQCKNDMEGIRDEYLNQDFPVLFTNKYNYISARIHCIIRFRCPQMEIADLIKNY